MDRIPGTLKRGEGRRLSRMSEKRARVSGAPNGSGNAGKGYLLPATRIILGVVFIYACYDKILHPEAFAEVIYRYQILPQGWIGALALVLPWLELLVGVFLVVGIWLPGTVLWANLLLVTFWGTLLYNTLRGLNVDCGCFGTTVDQATIYTMIWYLVRDGLFLIPAVYLLMHVMKGDLGTRRGWR